MRIHLKDNPNKVVVEYSPLPISDSSGYIYVKIRKGMYRLKESGIIAYKCLVHNLQPNGYVPVARTPGLWTHLTVITTFTLAVDDFSIKFYAAADNTHILDTLQKNYSITVDLSGSKYCRLTIKWNYPGNYGNISMPNSVRKYLE